MNYLRNTLVLLALVVVQLSAGSSAQTQSPPSILVFGDSLSAAYGINQEQSWVALLERRLKEQGYAHQVFNASISGETTAGGNSRLAASLKQSKAGIVILQLGGNDGLRGLAVEAMQKNLEQMIQLAKAQQVKVVLVGVRIPPSYGNAYSKAFAQTYTDLAKKYNVVLLADLLAPTKYANQLFQEDRIHPTAAAQPLLLEAVWKTIKPLLQ